MHRLAGKAGIPSQWQTYANVRYPRDESPLQSSYIASRKRIKRKLENSACVARASSVSSTAAAVAIVANDSDATALNGPYCFHALLQVIEPTKLGQLTLRSNPSLPCECVAHGSRPIHPLPYQHRKRGFAQPATLAGAGYQRRDSHRQRQPARDRRQHHSAPSNDMPGRNWSSCTLDWRKKEGRR